MNTIHYIVDYSTELLNNGGAFLGFLLVFLECFIPMLPLSVFVTFNINAFGFLFGIFISWIATCLGSLCCYMLFYFLEEEFFVKFFHKQMLSKIRRGMHSFEHISFSQLVLIITLPFTPSFLVNILSGISKLSFKKFICALLIGKLFMIVFWGYIGKNILESLTDIWSLVYIGCALLLSYIVSKIVGRRMNID